MKKIKMFGKTIPLALLVGILVIGVGSAAILEYYGTITGTAEVEQSVVLYEGNTWCTDNKCEYNVGNSPTYAGSTYVETVTVKNRANQQVPIEFVTTVKKCNSDAYTSCSGDHSSIITTRYYGELLLENKDANWAEISNDGTKATLKYDLVSSEFKYDLEATGLTPNTEYVLIYYADQQDKFVNWGGDNPGALIRKVTTDENGYILTSGSKEISMNLPHTDDWNLDADYSVAPDFYRLHSGAKIWLVPKDDYGETEKELTAWNPTTYLFETDMIDYSDSDKGGDTFNMNTGEIDINIENTFNPATEPGFYKITTKVVPT